MKNKTKNYFSFALFLLSVLLLTVFNTNADAQKKLDSEIIITIERTACFGSCPVYSAQIYADGTVVYDGEDFVKITGRKQHKISEEKLNQLVKAFKQINYFSLKNKYDSDENGMSVTDQPTTTTSIFLNGKRKKVINYYYAPKVLEELENTIDKIAGLHEYIGLL